MCAGGAWILSAFLGLSYHWYNTVGLRTPAQHYYSQNEKNIYMTSYIPQLWNFTKYNVFVIPFKESGTFACSQIKHLRSCKNTRSHCIEMGAKYIKYEG